MVGTHNACLLAGTSQSTGDGYSSSDHWKIHGEKEVWSRRLHLWQVLLDAVTTHVSLDTTGHHWTPQPTLPNAEWLRLNVKYDLSLT